MIWINVCGLLLIAFIVWWFWLYSPEVAEGSNNESLIVVDDGVYQPAYIQVAAGQPLHLIFLRKDASPCSETVIFPELDISRQLPAGKEEKIELPGLDAGTYRFHCQMQMYKGELRVS